MPKPLHSRWISSSTSRPLRPHDPGGVARLASLHGGGAGSAVPRRGLVLRGDLALRPSRPAVSDSRSVPGLFGKLVPTNRNVHTVTEHNPTGLELPLYSQSRAFHQNFSVFLHYTGCGDGRRRTFWCFLAPSFRWTVSAFVRVTLCWLPQNFRDTFLWSVVVLLFSNRMFVFHSHVSPTRVGEYSKLVTRSGKKTCE